MNISVRNDLVEIVLGVDKDNVVPVFTLYEDGELSLWGPDTKGVMGNARYKIPDWLAEGIRELVKNKIEQENNRGA